MSVCCDSQSDLHLVDHLIYHERTKHTEIKLHFIFLFCSATMNIYMGVIKLPQPIYKKPQAHINAKPCNIVTCNPKNYPSFSNKIHKYTYNYRLPNLKTALYRKDKDNLKTTCINLQSTTRQLSWGIKTNRTNNMLWLIQPDPLNYDINHNRDDLKPL